ncbi:MAG: hypothetical protein U0787_10070 [Polyangia bacterium]
MQRSLFGVPIPEGAVRATVKPVLGRGPSKPLWCGPIERDGVSVEETDIIVEVSENVSFWAYVDLQVKAKRIVQKDPSVWSFKVVVSFEDQAGVRTEARPLPKKWSFSDARADDGAGRSGDESASSVLVRWSSSCPKPCIEQTAAYHEKLATAGAARDQRDGQRMRQWLETRNRLLLHRKRGGSYNNKALAREGGSVRLVYQAEYANAGNEETGIQHL